MIRNIVLLFLGLFFILTQTVWSQYTVDGIEGFVLKPAFDSCLENHFNIIIEKDKDSTVTRKWIFDKTKGLIKELDFRESGFSSSMGGQTYSSTINYQEFNYRYNGDGKVAEVVQLKVQNLDTLKTIRRFDNSANNLVKESYIFKRDSLINKEVLKITYSRRTLKDSVVFTSIGRGNGFYSELISKSVFMYGGDNKINKELSYFKSNFFPLPVGEEPMKSKLSFVREYDYDNLGRIHLIKDNHYDAYENSQVYQIARFIYEGATSKIVGLNFPIFNGSDDENLVLKLQYGKDGCLKEITTEYGNKYYEYISGQ